MKLMSVEVKGDHNYWSFQFYGDPKYIADWEADGLKVSVICNTIPKWVPARYILMYSVIQDIFNFNFKSLVNLFK